MTIREFAREVEHEIVGRLRYVDKFGCEKLYVDDAENEYYISKRGVCIVTRDGGVI